MANATLRCLFLLFAPLRIDPRTRGEDSGAKQPFPCCATAPARDGFAHSGKPPRMPPLGSG